VRRRPSYAYLKEPSNAGEYPVSALASCVSITASAIANKTSTRMSQREWLAQHRRTQMTISEALEYAGEEFGLATDEALDFLDKVIHSDDFQDLVVALNHTCGKKETA